MRISDWSSDVCSSDLIDGKRGGADRDRHRQRDDHADPGARISNKRPLHAPAPGASTAAVRAIRGDGIGTSGNRLSRAPASTVTLTAIVAPCSWTATCIASSRSEEHTSELQSLMRNSYAVFCLNKKNRQNHKQTITRISHLIFTT